MVHFFWLVNACFCCVGFSFSTPSQDNGLGNVSEMTYFVSSGTWNLNLINNYRSCRQHHSKLQRVLPNLNSGCRQGHVGTWQWNVSATNPPVFNTGFQLTQVDPYDGMKLLCVCVLLLICCCYSSSLAYHNVVHSNCVTAFFYQQILTDISKINLGSDYLRSHCYGWYNVCLVVPCISLT